MIIDCHGHYTTTPPGVDAETGFYFDDTKRYVDAAAIDDTARAAIYEHNTRCVFPRPTIPGASS